MTNAFLEGALPEWDPVIYHEATSYGWRGLTAHGEVLEVKSSNGHLATVPSEILVAHAGKPIARRMVKDNAAIIDIDTYLAHFNAAIAHYKAGRAHEALVSCEAAICAAPTLRAKFNRAMILLALGRWTEGLAEYVDCEQDQPFMRPQVRAALDRGLKPWRGQNLDGKKLLVMHAHGFGDTLMMLRYLPRLWEFGGTVRLDVPRELASIAEPFAPLGIAANEAPPDYFCPILHLLHLLHVTPGRVTGGPYIETARFDWAPHHVKRIGIAWSIGKPSKGDYPREIPLQQLAARLGAVELVSVQTQGADEAKKIGIACPPLKDFAACADLMMQMDAIVSVDTAALHLAGAIGHPQVYGLLSYWSSWRWVAPWYDNVKLCRQTTPGDWDSAVAQIFE